MAGSPLTWTDGTQPHTGYRPKPPLYIPLRDASTLLHVVAQLMMKLNWQRGRSHPCRPVRRRVVLRMLSPRSRTWTPAVLPLLIPLNATAFARYNFVPHQPERRSQQQLPYSITHPRSVVSLRRFANVLCSAFTARGDIRAAMRFVGRAPFRCGLTHAPPSPWTPRSNWQTTWALIPACAAIQTSPASRMKDMTHKLIACIDSFNYCLVALYRAPPARSPSGARLLGKLHAGEQRVAPIERAR
jgi:hypothetical protein